MYLIVNSRLTRVIYLVRELTYYFLLSEFIRVSGDNREWMDVRIQML